VLAALAVLACEAPKPGPQLSVRMDSTVYVRDTSGMAHANFTIVNAGNVPVRLQRCCDRLTLVVDTGGPGRWVAYVGGAACLAICPIVLQVLQPGDSSRGSFAWDLPATYRVRVIYGLEQGDLNALQSAGAAFAIR
jgi:hypothetical protein